MLCMHIPMATWDAKKGTRGKRMTISCIVLYIHRKSQLLLAWFLTHKDSIAPNSLPVDS